MPQQGIDAWFSAAEGDEEVHRFPGAPLLQNVLAEGAASGGIEDATFLKKRKGVRGEDLGPFIAVVACRIAS